jgi:hypothetical protein
MNMKSEITIVLDDQAYRDAGALAAMKSISIHELLERILTRITAAARDHEWEPAAPDRRWRARERGERDPGILRVAPHPPKMCRRPFATRSARCEQSLVTFAV